MTASEYIEISRISKIHFYDLEKELLPPGNKYRALFEAHNQSIKDDFFETFFKKLENKDFTTLSQHFALFLISPFTNEDGDKFLKILEVVYGYENDEITNDLLDSLWIILDHVLHEWPIENIETDFKTALNYLSLKLTVLSNCSSDSIELLQQKISHF